MDRLKDMNVLLEPSVNNNRPSTEMEKLIDRILNLSADVFDEPSLRISKSDLPTSDNVMTIDDSDDIFSIKNNNKITIINPIEEGEENIKYNENCKTKKKLLNNNFRDCSVSDYNKYWNGFEFVSNPCKNPYYW